MRAALETRQRDAAARVEELEAEPARVRTALVEAEEVLRRRVIGLKQYLEALAEAGAPTVVTDGTPPRKPVGPRRTVPHRQDAAGTEVLSVDHQALITAAPEAGADGVGARRVAVVVLGWDSASASHAEEARTRLKRLVERGWPTVDKSGRFTLPAPGQAGAGRRDGGS
ncbi:hypothetical protein [Streptomyces sp. enrichment culture]|uniref:hypothetical protein n=1 Tax=Streptomyces sp. enrichment culture TaxID=1795815 RepID=UPI003F5432E9